MPIGFNVGVGSRGRNHINVGVGVIIDRHPHNGGYGRTGGTTVGVTAGGGGRWGQVGGSVVVGNGPVYGPGAGTYGRYGTPGFGGGWGGGGWGANERDYSNLPNVRGYEYDRIEYNRQQAAERQARINNPQDYIDERRYQENRMDAVRQREYDRVARVQEDKLAVQEGRMQRTGSVVRRSSVGRENDPEYQQYEQDRVAIQKAQMTEQLSQRRGGVPKSEQGFMLPTANQGKAYEAIYQDARNAVLNPLIDELRGNNTASKKAQAELATRLEKDLAQLKSIQDNSKSDPFLRSAEDWLKAKKQYDADPTAANKQAMDKASNNMIGHSTKGIDEASDNAKEAARYAAKYEAQKGKVSATELADTRNRMEYFASRSAVVAAINGTPGDAYAREAATLATGIISKNQGKPEADAAIETAISKLAKTGRDLGGKPETDGKQLPGYAQVNAAPVTQVAENNNGIGQSQQPRMSGAESIQQQQQQPSAKELSELAAQKAYDAKVAGLAGNKELATKLAGEAWQLSADVSKMNLSNEEKADKQVNAALSYIAANKKEDFDKTFNQLASSHVNKNGTGLDDARQAAKEAQMAAAKFAVNRDGSVDQDTLNQFATEAKQKAAEAAVRAELANGYKGNDPAIEASKKLAYANKANHNQAFGELAESGKQQVITAAREAQAKQEQENPSMARQAGKVFLGATGMVSPDAQALALGQRLVESVTGKKLSTGVAFIDDRVEGAKKAQDITLGVAKVAAAVGEGISTATGEFFGLSSGATRGTMTDKDALNALKINPNQGNQVAQNQQQSQGGRS